MAIVFFLGLFSTWKMYELSIDNEELRGESYNLKRKIESLNSELRDSEQEREKLVLKNLQMQHENLESQRLEIESRRGFNPSIYARKLGKLVLEKDDCNVVVLQSGNGYVIAELQSGSPQVGRVYAGDLDSYGTKTLIDVNGSGDIRVYIEDYMQSKSSLLGKLREHCND